MNPCCTGSSPAAPASPSTVRTSWPSAITASTVHDLTGVPSSHTTQTPQFEVSHPQWVPVSASSSRRKCTSSSLGSTSRRYSVPLTVTLICIGLDLPSGGAGGGAAKRPDGQLAGEMALVVDRSALVRRRPAVPRRDAPGLGEALLGGRPAAQGVLGLNGHEVLSAHRGQPDADLGYDVAAGPAPAAVAPAAGPAPAAAPTAAGPAAVAGTGQPQHRPGGGDRPVPGPALDLLVGATGAGGDRHPQLDQQLVLPDDGLVRAGVELAHRHRPLAGRTPDHSGRPQRGEHRRQVLRRVRLAHRA